MGGLQLNGEVKLNLSLNSFSCPFSLVQRELAWLSACSGAEEKQLIWSFEVAQVCNSTNTSLAIRSVCCIT